MKPKTVPLPPSHSFPFPFHPHSYLPGRLRKPIVPYQRYIRVQTARLEDDAEVTSADSRRRVL